MTAIRRPLARDRIIARVTVSADRRTEYTGDVLVLDRPRSWRSDRFPKFRVAAITEDVDLSASGWNYTVVLRGPVQTTRGADHAVERDSVTYSARSRVGSLADIPEPVRAFLAGEEALVAEAMKALRTDLAAVGVTSLTLDAEPIHSA